MRRKLLSSQKKSSEQGQKLLTTDGSINLTFRDEPELAAAKEVSLQQIQHIVIGD
jgi:glutamine cyclotransferase